MTRPTSAAGRPDGLTIAAFITVAVLGGLNAIAVKATVRELDPLWSAGLRFEAATVILAAIVLATRRALPHGRSLVAAVLYGAFAFSSSYGLVYPALRVVPAGTAMVFIALVPLETFALAILLRQEHFRLAGLVGAVISVIGVLIVVWNQLGAAVPLGPMLQVLIGTFFIAAGAVVLKSIPRADPYATNTVAMGVGGAGLLAASLVAGETWVLPTAWDTWLGLVYLVLLGSIALFGLYLYALQRWTASAVSYTTLLMPLVTIPVASVLFGEPITLPFVLGAALAIAGIYIGAFRSARPSPSSATATPECLPIEDCEPALQPAR